MEVEEQRGLEDAISRAEERMATMNDVRGSHLYIEWHRLFSAHLRGGNESKDFSPEVFLKEVPRHDESSRSLLSCLFHDAGDDVENTMKIDED